MKLANNMLLRVLGVLLLTAAVLKGWQLINEPLADNNIWSSRWFHIMIVEFELAMGIWLVSGLFNKTAWLATLGLFSMFSIITLYKGITGYASCGCFGQVHVNPWMTLFAVDLPAVIALLVFKPQFSLKSIFSLPRALLSLLLAFLALPQKRKSLKLLTNEFVRPLPSVPHFAITLFLGILILGITTPILALNEPAIVTSKYEVLEPEIWIGKELPILEHIDIADTLKKGTWLILLYHYDCPDCGRAIPEYEQIARDLAGNEDFMQIAFIAVPPYGHTPISENSPCTLGKLNDVKEWFVTTPAVALLKDGKVIRAWEGKVLDYDIILSIST
ncbi:MAG: hypothetical protein JXA96_11125 [Sedimentisphaerales bacterium]|nr:hypothetical protein [Sedimentisphaerales bacterium]